jgi:hypothetical protein
MDLNEDMQKQLKSSQKRTQRLWKRRKKGRSPTLAATIGEVISFAVVVGVLYEEVSGGGFRATSMVCRGGVHGLVILVAKLNILPCIAPRKEFRLLMLADNRLSVAPGAFALFP